MRRATEHDRPLSRRPTQLPLDLDLELRYVDVCYAQAGILFIGCSRIAPATFPYSLY